MVAYRNTTTSRGWSNRFLGGSMRRLLSSKRLKRRSFLASEGSWNIDLRFSFIRKLAIQRVLQTTRLSTIGIGGLVGQVQRLLVLLKGLLVGGGLGVMGVHKGCKKLGSNNHLLRFKLNCLFTQAMLVVDKLSFFGGRDFSRRSFTWHYRVSDRYLKSNGMLFSRLGVLLFMMRQLVVRGGGTKRSFSLVQPKLVFSVLEQICWQVFKGWKTFVDSNEPVERTLSATSSRRGWLRYYWSLVDLKQRLARLPLWVRAFGSRKYSWRFLRYRPYALSGLNLGQDGLFFWKNQFRSRGGLGENWLGRFRKFLSIQLKRERFSGVLSVSLECAKKGRLVPTSFSSFRCYSGVSCLGWVISRTRCVVLLVCLVPLIALWKNYSPLSNIINTGLSIRGQLLFFFLLLSVLKVHHIKHCLLGYCRGVMGSFNAFVV